ncbi:MAG: histidine kinase [Chloroflexota bacterium]
MLMGMNNVGQDVGFADEERPFRFTFTLMYMSLIAAVIYFNLISQCTTRSLFSGAGAMVIILLVLLGIERYEHQHLDPHLSQQVAVILLLARIFLVEAIVYLDCAHFAPLLYPIIPFSAYFSFRPYVSNGLSLAYFLIYLTRLWLGYPGWYGSQAILTVFLIFVLLLAFMQMMARVIDQDEHRRRRTEHLLSDLEASHVKLQAYAAQVAELAATEERNRLARDIHDSLGHYLTAVNVQLEKAQAFWERSPEESQQAIGEARQLAREALQDVRRSVAALRDTDSQFSLHAALADLVRGVANGRFHIKFQVDGDESGYARPVLMALYRAAQEGLTNVQKHTEATAVTLTLTCGDEEARLCLWDNGQGLIPPH